MGYTTDTISKAVGEALEKSTKRKFSQSVDLAINLKDLDMNKPENRLNEEVILPKGRGKERIVAVVAESEMAHSSKDVADKIISKEELEEMAKDKKAAKKVANSVDFFIAQTDLMTTIGRFLGPVLGPRGKMPKPIPANVPVGPLVERLKKTVRVKTKEKPILHVVVGTEGMSNEDLTENIEAVFGLLERKLEKGHNNIKNAYIKTTMGPSVLIEG